MDKVISIRDLWRILIKHIVPIALAALICLAALFVYSKVQKPQYASTATVYILKNDGEEKTQADFNVAISIIDDCIYTAKSPEVLNAVIDDMELDTSLSALSEAVSVINPDGTRFIEISVKSDSPERAKQIADRISAFASEKIERTMDISQVRIFSEGSLDGTPCNAVGLYTYALGAFICALFVYLFFLIRFMINEKTAVI